MKTYAAYYDNEIRNYSSSGGIFSVLASKFEIIYGVALSDDCYQAKYHRISNGNIERLRGSKYLQVNVGDTFKQVKEDLNNGKQVLFTGTGCIINGLKCFLQKNYDNLVTVDVVCHGGPSPELWKKYVKHQEMKYGKLISVNFRCKDRYRKKIVKNQNQLYISKDIDPYFQMFLRNYSLRPSCYECHAKKYKQSDITIADFWGIEKICQEMNDGKGTSLVITRTQKGEELFDDIKCELKWKQVSYEDGIRDNPSEYQSVIMPLLREKFFYDLNILPFNLLEKKYLDESIIKKSSKKIKHYIKNILRRDELLKQNNNADYGILFTFDK